MSDQELIDRILAHILDRFEKGIQQLEGLHGELVEKFPEYNWKDHNSSKKFFLQVQRWWDKITELGPEKSDEPSVDFVRYKPPAGVTSPRDFEKIEDGCEEAIGAFIRNRKLFSKSDKVFKELHKEFLLVDNKETDTNLQRIIQKVNRALEKEAKEKKKEKKTTAVAPTPVAPPRRGTNDATVQAITDYIHQNRLYGARYVFADGIAEIARALDINWYLNSDFSAIVTQAHREHQAQLAAQQPMQQQTTQQPADELEDEIIESPARSPHSESAAVNTEDDYEYAGVSDDDHSASPSDQAGSPNRTIHHKQ